MTLTDFTNVMKDLSGYISYSIINRMLNYCREIGDKDTFMLILTLSRTGRRITEIVGEKPYTYVPGLRVRDIRLEDGLIEWSILKKKHVHKMIRTPEGKIKKLKEEDYLKKLEKKYSQLSKRKLIPADETFLNMLVKYAIYKKLSENDRIFPITRQRAWQKIKKISKDLHLEHIKPITPKIFRHSFAVNYIKSKSNDPSALIKLKELLDHSKIDITSIYLQFGQDDIKKDLGEMFK